MRRNIWYLSLDRFRADELVRICVRIQEEAFKMGIIEQGDQDSADRI